MGEKHDRELRSLGEAVDRLVNPDATTDSESPESPEAHANLARYLQELVAIGDAGLHSGALFRAQAELSARFAGLPMADAQEVLRRLDHEDDEAEVLGTTVPKPVPPPREQATGVQPAADRTPDAAVGADSPPVEAPADSEPDSQDGSAVAGRPAPLPPGVRPLTAEERSVVSNRLGAWDEAEVWRRRLEAQRQTRRQP